MRIARTVLLEAVAGTRPPGSGRPFPPPDWEDAEDLEVELSIAAASLAAIKRRFSRCDADLAHALLSEIKARQLDAHALLGIDGSVDLDDEADSGALSQDQLERLFKGLRVPGASSDKSWGHLEAFAVLRRDAAEDAIHCRRRQEERLRMTAALATPRSLETVMRYETHLSREFARILSQLVQQQGTDG